MDALILETMNLLKENRDRLTRQQFRTLKGQVLAGDITGATKGLQKLLTKKGGQQNERNKHSRATE